MANSEQQIQTKVISVLENRGAYVVKVISASRSGVPDLIACYNGIFIGIEVKKPSTKANVSKLQQHNLNQILKAKGQALVVWSPEQVEELLDLL